MPRRRSILIAALLTGIPALAVSVGPARGETADEHQSVEGALERLPQVETYQLPNGLSVILQPIPWQTRVAVVVSYAVGSRDDPPGLLGLAHMTEHMSFRGSRHLAAYEALSLVDAAGGNSGAETRLESTTYHTIVPSGALAQALWIESERMAFTLERFSEASLLHERDAIEDEYRLTTTLGSKFEVEVRNALFGEEQPYARAVRQKLDPLDLEDVQTFFRCHYRAEHATLVVAGGMDVASARAQIERYFGPIWNPSRPCPRRDVAPVKPMPAHRRILHTMAPAQLFAVRWIMSNLSSEERLALELLARIMNTRFRVLVDRDRATSVGVSIEPHNDFSVFEIDARLAADQALGPLEYALREHIERIWSTDLTVDLEHARESAILGTVAKLESPLALAMETALSLSTAGRPLDIRARVRGLGDITANEIVALRPHFLHPLFVWGDHVKLQRGSSLF